MLTPCAEDAADRATAGLKSFTFRLLQDGAERDRRLAEAMLEFLTGLVKGVSDSMDSRLTNLEQRVQDQWKTFCEKWENGATRRQRGYDHPSGAPHWDGGAKRCRREVEELLGQRRQDHYELY